MRILALLYAVMAVSLWWVPLPRFSQSLVLVVAAVMALAIHEDMKRLDRAHKAATEAREILRQVRDARPENPS